MIYTPEILPVASDTEVLRGVPAPRDYRDQAGVFHHEWESPRQLGEWLAKIGKCTSQDGHVNKPSPSWCDGWNVSAAIRRAIEGWPEGAAAMRKAVTSADKAIATYATKETTRHAIAGSYVDVGAFLGGQPECMVEFAPDETQTRRVNIVIDAWVGAGVSAETMAARGAAIAGAALALQAMGVSVDMAIQELAEHPTRRGEVHECKVHVWQSGRVFDAATLAAAMHPGFIRSLLYRAQRWSQANLYPGLNFGGSNRFGTIKPAPGLVLVDGMEWANHPWESREGCEAFMRSCLKASR